MKYQDFVRNISLSDSPETYDWRNAWKQIEKAITELNELVQLHIKSGMLTSIEEGVPRCCINFKILNIEQTFMRDTGRFDGCTGEIYGVGEDRYHWIRTRIYFESNVQHKPTICQPTTTPRQPSNAE